MDLPYVRGKTLFIEGNNIPLETCRFQDLEIILDQPEEVVLLDNSNWGVFIFPNRLGNYRAFFILEECRVIAQGHEEILEFKNSTLTEIHFELYQPVRLQLLSQKHGQPRFLQSNGISFAAFNQHFLARIKKGQEVDCLWFLNFEAIKKSLLPSFYRELVQLFISELIH